MSVVERARMVAFAAHGAIDHRRKYTGAPYTSHLAEVAQICEQAGLPPAAVAAAWLHDILEDTKIEYHALINLTDPLVADLVYWLTDGSEPKDGNRKTRKAIDRSKLMHSPKLAQSIKYADIISNTASIVAHDKKFAKVYIPEMEALLAVIPCGDERLYEKAKACVMKAKYILAESPKDAIPFGPNHPDYIHW